MGIEIGANGRVNFRGGADALHVVGGFGRCKILQKTFEMTTDFSGQADNADIITSFVPAGSLVLGMAVKVVKAITTSGTPTTLNVKTQTPLQIYCSFTVTSNAVALDTTAIQNGAVASATFYPTASNLDLGFTGGASPTATAGRLRITMWYIQFTA